MTLVRRETSCYGDEVLLLLLLLERVIYKSGNLLFDFKNLCLTSFLTLTNQHECFK